MIGLSNVDSNFTTQYFLFFFLFCLIRSFRHNYLTSGCKTNIYGLLSIDTKGNVTLEGGGGVYRSPQASLANSQYHSITYQVS